MSSAANSYVHPGFAPVRDELSGIPLRVAGVLPADLDGMFLRNGANALFARRRPHMFDGAAMLHMVELRGGEARYSNATLRTPHTRHIEELGRDPFLGVGDLAGGGRGALMALIADKWLTRLGVRRSFAPLHAVSSSTSILHHDRRLFGLQETGLPFALDVARDPQGWLSINGGGSLEDFAGTLTTPFSAHPKIDVDTGAVHSISHDIISGTTTHVMVSPGGKLISAPIATERPPAFFVHDFIVTERFVIFPDSSLRFEPSGLAKRAGSIARFAADRPLRFGVIPRDPRVGTPVRWFETRDAGHIWHFANGWEEGDQILVHAPVFRDYPDTLPIHTPDEPHALFTRWRLDLATGSVSEEKTLLEHFYERPGIDPRRYGRRSRYAWLLDEGRGGVMGKGVLKYDMIAEREAGMLDYGPLHGGEPLFVPTGPGEDEGYLVDLLADGETAVLMIADARDMTERCRIPLPQRVPFGVHGLWLDRAAADQLHTTPSPELHSG